MRGWISFSLAYQFGSPRVRSKYRGSEYLSSTALVSKFLHFEVTVFFFFFPGDSGRSLVTVYFFFSFFSWVFIGRGFFLTLRSRRRDAKYVVNVLHTSTSVKYTETLITPYRTKMKCSPNNDLTKKTEQTAKKTKQTAKKNRTRMQWWQDLALCLALILHHAPSRRSWGTASGAWCFGSRLP